ncbi:MAG TPA: DMT family transporter [Chitinophagaceae bacterium]|nr:DMT family transporter [Chitinophagaceae bacterium]
MAVLLTNLFFAVNLSMVKHISPSVVGPYGLNVLRVGISLLLFWMVWIFGRTAAGIRRKDLPRFILCGLTGVAINQMLFIKGLTMTSTIHASLLMLCTPLLITVFAFWILKEKITFLKSLGLALGIGGAVLLIMSKEKNGTASLSGDMLIVLNAMAYTIYFILVKPLMQEYPPLHVVRWVFTFGFLMIVPFGWIQFTEVQWIQFDWSHFISLFTIVICGTFLAYSFNIFGIKHLGAGVTGSYIYTQPVFAAIIAAFFLKEDFNWEKVIAGLMIFSGVFLVSRKAPPVIEE